MGGMFKAPKPPEEDPEIKQMREQERIKAEADRTRALQDQLKTEGRIRSDSSGIRSLLGSLFGGRVRSLLGAG